MTARPARRWLGQSGLTAVGALALTLAGSTVASTAASEQAREVLRAHCGSCHRPGLPTSKPAALKIFDLDRSDWFSTMTTEQLDKGLKRLEGMGGVTPTDRARYVAFADEEKSRRQASHDGSGSP
jgi:hypothetical protein